MTTADLYLEPAGLAHVHDMRALDARVYPTPWSDELWRRELGRSAADRCFVAGSTAGHHVGHGGLMVQAGDGHIITVAVDPNRHRQGIAGQIMVVLARRAINLGLDAMTLEVRLGNAAAQALYRRVGFAPAGIRPRYYGDDGEDALIMWAHGVCEGPFGRRLDGLAADLGPVQMHPDLAAMIATPAREKLSR